MDNEMEGRGAVPVSPNEKELDEIIQQMALSEEDANALRSITRLLVGGALMSWDELLVHIRSWEGEVQEGLALQTRERAGAAGSVWPGDAQARREQAAETMRYTLIGLMFESQDRLSRRSKAALQLADQATGAVVGPIGRWMQRSGLVRPARSRFDTLVQRGEQVTNRWALRGRQEEIHSRRLVEAATKETFNYSMDQLGQAPALQDLVKKQSAGLSQDVLDEVRKRTVTGDLVAESLARRILRRSPRQLPSAAEDEQEPTG